MVGLFSRFSVSRSTHRRSKTSLEEGDVLPPNLDAPDAATLTSTTTAHGIEVAVEFKPVEHPVEPFDNDKPIQCPLPEPSILNDGRMWKERASASLRMRAELPVVKYGDTLESKASGTQSEPNRSNRLFLPSLSAPEHDLLNFLQERDASGI